ncbi:chromosome transmission fidelity protein 8 homolog [Ischnura elegans]|uniref:chromosome transmission fidelity protein 8 homolog n=1 Tax=Ischnura elegans TaxID=197161 RepID=UPI001ED8991A|nr:chromosome transmission fidelity protein 8 homolog [Ischnura elegans]
MQILINVSTVEKTKEWAIIELQGDLESRIHSDVAGKFIGDLHYSQQKIPILIIGHHILHGKLIPLEKPFAVLEKRKTANLDAGLRENGNKCVYEVKTIVHKKLIFKTRPKPIIANVYAGQA